MIACLPPGLTLLLVRSKKAYDAGLTHDDPLKVAFWCVIIALILIPTYWIALRRTREHIEDSGKARRMLYSAVAVGIIGSIAAYLFAAL